MGFLLVAGSQVSILFPFTYRIIFRHNQSVVCPRPKCWLPTRICRTQRDSSAVFINWVTGLKRGFSHLNWRYRTGFTSFCNPHGAMLVVPTRKDVMLFTLLLCLQWPALPSYVQHTVACSWNSVPSTQPEESQQPACGPCPKVVEFSPLVALLKIHFNVIPRLQIGICPSRSLTSTLDATCLAHLVWPSFGRPTSNLRRMVANYEAVHYDVIVIHRHEQKHEEHSRYRD